MLSTSLECCFTVNFIDFYRTFAIKITICHAVYYSYFTKLKDKIFIIFLKKVPKFYNFSYFLPFCVLCFDKIPNPTFQTRHIPFGIYGPQGGRRIPLDIITFGSWNAAVAGTAYCRWTQTLSAFSHREKYKLLTLTRKPGSNALTNPRQDFWKRIPRART